MKLIIARHGETIENKTGIIQGHSPGTLSKKGERQVKRLATRLLKEKIDVIYSSDLRRCRQTLKPFLELNKIKAHYVKELREKNHGIFNGKKRTEFQRYFKSKEYANWIKKKKIKPDWLNNRFPRGESFKDLYRRSSKIINKIITKEKGRNVLIVTHGGTKRMILSYLLKRDIRQIRKLHILNTAVSIIKINDDGIHKARLLSNIGHLS